MAGLKDLILNIQSLGGHITDLVFPVYCLRCRQDGKSYLCEDCLPQLPRLKNQVCLTCQQPSPFGKTHPECESRQTVDGIISALPYHHPLVRKIIAAFKYSFAEHLAERLSRIVIQEMEHQGLAGFFSDFKIVPVPLHPRRQNWRGFNQSLLLAQPLAAKLHIPIEQHLILRSRFTKPQTELKKEQRARNIQGAFQITQSSPGKYLLLDDVVTTGATLKEIARMLKQNGAAEVWAATLAHG